MGCKALPDKAQAPIATKISTIGTKIKKIVRIALISPSISAKLTAIAIRKLGVMIPPTRQLLRLLDFVAILTSFPSSFKLIDGSSRGCSGGNLGSSSGGLPIPNGGKGGSSSGGRLCSGGGGNSWEGN